MSTNAAQAAPQQPTDNPNNRRDSINLRREFIAMLFALAVSEVAIHTAELVMANEPIGRKWPAATHLLLSLSLISVSWVGWSRSNLQAEGTPVVSILSHPFLMLTLDVVIVVAYFVLVRQVEVQTKSDEPTLRPKSSAVPEVLAMVVISGLYWVWDVAGDRFGKDSLPPRASWVGRRWAGARIVFLSGLASIAGIGMSYNLIDVARGAGSPAQVVCLDLALIFSVFLFRLAKHLEMPAAKLLKISDARAFVPRPHQGERWVTLVAVLFLVCYAVCAFLGATPVTQWPGFLRP